MDSCDEDLFAISDEEEVSTSMQTVQTNPVQEYLSKQLNDVQNRIDTTINKIHEVRENNAHVLDALQLQALHGVDVNSEFDTELYTVEGEPVMKEKQSHSIVNEPKKNLEVVYQFQCILHDKWIIGIELENKSMRTLNNLRYYPYIKDEIEIHGTSMFWQLQQNHLWDRIDTISSGTLHVVATVVLDVPTFDRRTIVDCWGVILYEIDEIEFQCPVPLVQLTVAETINNACMKMLNESEHNVILSLKSTSNIERIVNIQLSKADDADDKLQKKKLIHFLVKKNFEKVYGDVFLIRQQDSLMYCLVEVLSVVNDEASIRIFSRSVSQLNILLHFLRDEFPKVTIEESVDKCVEAARALLRELEMIRDNRSALEIQEARLITDLLLP